MTVHSLKFLNEAYTYLLKKISKKRHPHFHLRHLVTRGWGKRIDFYVFFLIDLEFTYLRRFRAKSRFNIYLSRD